MAEDDNGKDIQDPTQSASTDDSTREEVTGEVETTKATGQAESNLDLPEHEGTPQNPNGSALDPTNLTDEDREKGLKVLYEVPVQVSAILGKTTMQVSQLLKLGRGAVIELDRRVGDAIDIYVNDRLVARGEVIIVDEHLGVTLTEIIKADQAA